jgi:hypothetical protein
MHGQQNIKFVSAQQAKQIYQDKNTKEKLHKTNAPFGLPKRANRNS